MAHDTVDPIKRALVSVWDKTGVIELAKALSNAGVEIVSTGSTATGLAEAGIAVTRVEEVTGFAECLDGRVKTLHPHIHAGILADRSNPGHRQQLTELNIEPFDLVVVNLYPFSAVLAEGTATEAEQVEMIDIGGPTMIRAAAKNFGSVAVITDPSQYDDVRAALRKGGFTASERKQLAAHAFAVIRQYDTDIANWFTSLTEPASGSVTELRYGENPHQKAWLHQTGETGIAAAKQLHGKAMSYNNFVDADAAWQAAWDHDVPAVAIIKHANPCGIAISENPDQDPIAHAYQLAFATDPLSAYGGVVAANRTVTAQMAREVAKVFIEAIIAPGYEADALEILQAKKNLRILELAPPIRGGETSVRPVGGGELIQDVDRYQADGDDPVNWTLVAGPAADEATLADLEFAWRSVRAVKSNAILLAKDGAAVGIGMGQVNRVDACKLAVERANTLAPSADSDGAPEQRANGSVAASDAFFPFPDGLEILLDAGVRGVVQPGGSIRDADAIAAAERAGVPMYFTGVRHFAH